MKKRILIPTLIIGTLLTGSLALAGPGFGSGNCGRGNGDCASGSCEGKGQGAMSYEQHEERMDRQLEMMSTVLELTDAQKEQIESLLNQQWQDKQGQHDEMQAAREAMRAARSAGTFNEADFRAKAVKMAALKTERMVEREKTKQQIYAVLTPEQQEKAETLQGLMGGKGRHGGKGFRF